MITTSNIGNILSIENIRKLVNDEQIFRYYIDYDFKVGDIFHSPLRKDKNPSFGIYYNKHYNKLMFNDYNGTGGDVFTFVQKLFSFNTITEGLNQINQDFDLNLTPQYNTNFKVQPANIKNISSLKITSEDDFKKVLQIEVQPFSQEDIKYWNQFHISETTLRKFKVYSVKKLFRNKILNRVYNDLSPMYGYLFNSGNIKIYRPLEESRFEKWRSNCNNDTDLQGYAQLPLMGELLIITKSLKDVMCLYEMGIPSIAPHGEGQYIDINILKELQTRFTTILSLFDNDDAGKKYTIKFYENYNIIGFTINDDFKSKDISDLIVKTNFNIAKQFMKDEIDKHKKNRN